MLTAVITGVAGQDGSYLSEYLLELGYRVIGITRRTKDDKSLLNISGIMNNPMFELTFGDITDSVFISQLLCNNDIHEFYNLAAQSHVGYSFQNPSLTMQVNANAVLMHLDFIRMHSPATRYYNAATSEMFGGVDGEVKYTEASPFNPRSPYAISKVAAFYSVKNYRDAYGLHASSGILFNHSSPRRGMDFALRKITRGVKSVSGGLQSKVRMGDLSAFRDEGHSKDYVKAMHLMVKSKSPSDYIISTGNAYSIREMFQIACDECNLDFEKVYELDERFIRPSEVKYLCGDATKAQTELGWKPEYNIHSLIKEMLDNDEKELYSF
jgi:GDPmannose 4,6-dehydratase